jgi:hypothetical protein
MKRFSLLAIPLLALLAVGCFGGGSANTATQKSPKSRNTALVVHFSMTTLGQAPIKQTYRISCADMGTGDGGVTFVCGRLTGSLQARYFAVPSDGPISEGPEQAAVAISGTVNGERGRRSYYLGSQQFRDWMQILGRYPTGVAKCPVSDACHGSAVGWRVGP